MKTVNLKQKVLHRPPKGYKKPLIASMFVFICIFLLSLSPIGEFITYQITLKSDFKFRHWIKKEPTLHENIKILVLDDYCVAKLRSDKLTLAQWSTLINGINSQQPKAIIIDKIFGIIDESPEQIAEFVSKTKHINNLFIASFFTPQQIYGKEIIPSQLYDDQAPHLQEIKWIKENKFYHYGSIGELRESLKKIGHINYVKPGYIAPFFKTSDSTVSTYLGLKFAEKIDLKQDGLYINNNKVSLNSNSHLLVNMLHNDKFSTKIFRIINTLNEINSNKDISRIKKDDIVLILPNFFTGNFDSHDTTVGLSPGGFILGSVINSVLSKNWIKVFDYHWLILLCICTIVVLTSHTPIAIFAITNIFILPLIVTVSGLILFSYLNIVIDWLFPSLAAILSGIIIFFIQTRSLQDQSKKIKIALGNTIAPERLELFVNSPEKFKIESSSQLVTTMFIDMVGFSLAAERQTPENLFLDLKQFSTLARNLIHKHGGIVDKNLGDGLLCFFGYNFSIERNKGEINQADQALACAIEIQKQNTLLCLERHKQQKAVYLLRIGINTSNVYVGDLGNDHQVEFTLVGDGVNYASRLEEACEPGKVFISATTKDFLSKSNPRLKDLKMRNLTIKHHSEVLEAYEYDPSQDSPEILSQAILAYKEFAGFERKEQRWQLPEGKTITLQFLNDTGKLIDFSLNGLSIESTQFYSRAIEFELNFDENCNDLFEDLIKLNVLPLKVEVRWGRKIDSGYLHGLLLKNLNEHQKSKLFHCIRKYLYSK